MRRISQQEWENEHMHNPMTEGEALAVDAACRAYYDAMGYPQYSPSDWAQRAMRAAIAAHTAASAGEKPVAWWNGISNDWLGPEGSPPSIRWGADAESSGHDIPLYAGFNPIHTAPPAAVPADALTNLVERWLLHSDPYHGKCADELAALIPKGADHA